MSRRRAGPFSSSWPTLLLVAIGTSLGVVLLGVGIAPRVHQPPSGMVDAATIGGVAADAGPSPERQRDSTMTQVSSSLVPVRLEIPAIGVETVLVRLGLMPDHTVEVPSNADRAGWFHRGPRPGGQGSAVILGHLDSQDGPAVFARLQELQPGDAVSVERADGTTLRFVVRRSMLYGHADFPADRVYAAPGARRLNLITCGGLYDPTRGGYQANLVVYTRLAPRDSAPQ